MMYRIDSVVSSLAVEVSQIVAFSRFRFIAYYTKMRGWISMNQIATNVYLKCPR